MRKPAESNYTSALNEIRNRILGDEEQLELLKPLCHDICSIDDPEYVGVTIAAINVATEIFLELFARYPKAMAGMALVGVEDLNIKADLKEAQERLSMSDADILILTHAIHLRNLCYKFATLTVSTKLCKAALYNMLEILRTEALIEAHQDSSIILSQTQPWKDTGDGSIGIFPLHSYILFIRYILRPQSPKILNDTFIRTFSHILNEYSDICFFTFSAIDAILRDIHDHTSIEKIATSISISALTNIFQLALDAANHHIKEPTTNYYIDYIAVSVACIKGYARSASIPGISGLIDLISRSSIETPQRKLSRGILDRVNLLWVNNSSRDDIAKERTKGNSTTMRKHNLSQINAMFAEAKRLERENVAQPEIEKFTPAYALENAEGIRAVLFACYYSICELLFSSACSIVRQSVAVLDFAPAHNGIISILSISNKVTKHATSSSQTVYLIASMKKLSDLQKSLENITKSKLPATHYARKFSLAYKLMVTDAMFDLCTSNNLPLNNFFDHLFSLLTPKIFSIPGCRQRILRLLAKCLQTSYVASSIQACLLKRLTIISLSVSANVTLSIVMLIIATLKRHTNLRWLLKNQSQEEPADVSVFYASSLSLSNCLQLWEGTSTPNITLIELTGLRNHYHPLIRKLIHLLESGSAFTTVQSYSKADGDFYAVVDLDEREFIEQEFAKSMSSNEISAFNAENLIPNLKHRLIEGVDALDGYPGFPLIGAAVKQGWGSDLSNIMINLAEQRGSGIIMHSILQKVKTDVDFVVNNILSDCWIWNNQPFPTYIAPQPEEGSEQ